MHRSRGAINLLWQQRLASSALSGGAVANNTKRVVPILQMHSASSPPPPAMEVRYAPHCTCEDVYQKSFMQSKWY